MPRMALVMFEDRLAEEVRRYRHLYDRTSKYYKNSVATMHSWKEIGETLATDPNVCIRKWKSMRDKFVRLKKKLRTESGSPDAVQRVPDYYMMLSWLQEYVIHRRNADTETDSVVKIEFADRGPTPEPLRSTLVPIPVEDLRDTSTPLLDGLGSPSPGPLSPSQKGARRRPGWPPLETCSDDEGLSASESSASCTPSSCDSINKRPRVSSREGLLESMSPLPREQRAVTNSAKLQSLHHAHAIGTRDHDEFLTFAMAVADSLRKLPAEKVEATKSQVFAVLGEAHTH